MHPPGGENHGTRHHLSPIQYKAPLRWCLIALLTVVLVFGVLFALEDDGPSSWPKTAFEPQKWAETKETERYVFVNDLLDGQTLIGKSSPDVYQMLGKPSSDDPLGGTMSYGLREDGNDIHVLLIYFDESKPVRHVREVFATIL
jgi:hypothetical protein